MYLTVTTIEHASMQRKIDQTIELKTHKRRQAKKQKIIKTENDYIYISNLGVHKQPWKNQNNKEEQNHSSQGPT